MTVKAFIALCFVATIPAVYAQTESGAELMIPFAGSTAGALGTFFRTDVSILNYRDVEQPLVIGFYPLNEDFLGYEREATVVLPPHSTTNYEDVVATLFERGGVGAIVINDRTSGPRFDPNAKLVASYRIWTRRTDGNGTTSQSSMAVSLSALPPGRQTRVAFGVRQDADFRCNVGIVNLNYGSRSYRVTASSPSGSVTTGVMVVGSSMTQVPLPQADLGYVTVTVEPLDTLDADVWTAYATSVDNHSGDGWLQNATAQSVSTFTVGSGPPAWHLIVPIAGSAEGAFGTLFHTDLTIFNHRNVAQLVTMSFRPGTNSRGAARPVIVVTIPPRAGTTYVDVARLLGSEGLGSIDLEATYADGYLDGSDLSAQLEATTRIWTNDPNGNGTMSQSANALEVLLMAPAGQLPKVAIGARLDDKFRCNVGIAIMGTAYGRSFRITASSPAGSVTTTAYVPADSSTQVALPTANLGYVTVTVEPLEPDGNQWAAYASSVDNSSGDGWLVNAESH